MKRGKKEKDKSSVATARITYQNQNPGVESADEGAKTTQGNQRSRAAGAILGGGLGTVMQKILYSLKKKSLFKERES